MPVKQQWININTIKNGRFIMTLNRTLEEIDILRQELERHLAKIMCKELTKWQLESALCISDVNIRLASLSSTENLKTNVVTSVSVDLAN